MYSGQNKYHASSNHHSNDCHFSVTRIISWWRHQMETFSALLALCEGNSPVAGEFPAQRPVTRSFDVFFDLRLNERLSKQSWGWWSETPPRSLWRQCNVMPHVYYITSNNQMFTKVWEVDNPRASIYWQIRLLPTIKLNTICRRHATMYYIQHLFGMVSETSSLNNPGHLVTCGRSLRLA